MRATQSVPMSSPFWLRNHTGKKAVRAFTQNPDLVAFMPSQERCLFEQELDKASSCPDVAFFCGDEKRWDRVDRFERCAYAPRKYINHYHAFMTECIPDWVHAYISPRPMEPIHILNFRNTAKYKEYMTRIKHRSARPLLMQIPKGERHPDLVRASVLADSSALLVCTDLEQRTCFDLLSLLIQSGGDIIRYFKLPLTKDMVKVATDQSSTSLAFVPPHLQTQSMIISCIRRNPKTIYYVARPSYEILKTWCAYAKEEDDLWFPPWWRFEQMELDARRDPEIARLFVRMRPLQERYDLMLAHQTRQRVVGDVQTSYSLNQKEIRRARTRSHRLRRIPPQFTGL